MIGRALLKAGSYRLLGTLATVVTVGSLTSLWRFAWMVALLEAVVKVILYALHELAWELARRKR